MNQPIKLTTLSHGSGCGCKISPGLLNRLLKSIVPLPDSRLLSTCDTADDAALYRLSAECVLIVTTDFFMPIVDDPFDFGRIAAANALSDIYAMGGEPILALNLLGVPAAKLRAEAIEQILAGGQAICQRVAVAVGGGHSIDCREAFYGLSVCGSAHPNHIKRNSTAQSGDALILAKPLGIGVLAAAHKQGKLDAIGHHTLIAYATQLNDVGAELAKNEAVHAMTDVTGFGLLGHLLELCKASGLQASLRTDAIPLFNQAVDLVADGVMAAASVRNWEYCRDSVALSDKANAIKTLLTDPQTNGGLLVACSPDAAAEVQKLLIQRGFQQANCLGQLDCLRSKKTSTIVRVI